MTDAVLIKQIEGRSVFLSQHNGVNTTELLANKLNHPIREIHTYMAMKLLECMLFN